MKMTMKTQNEKSRSNLLKYYKFVKTCLGCRKKYGSDTNSKTESQYCSECLGKLQSGRLKTKGRVKNEIDNHTIVRRYLANGKEI